MGKAWRVELQISISAAVNSEWLLEICLTDSSKDKLVYIPVSGDLVLVFVGFFPSLYLLGCLSSKLWLPVKACTLDM